MIIVNDKYAIDSDHNQWIIRIYMKATEKYPEKWEPYKYFMSLESAVKGLSGILLRTSHYHTAEELSSNAEAIAALLDVKLKGIKVSYE